MTPSTAEGDVEHATRQARQRRTRVSKFLRVLFVATVAVHVPVGLGVAELVRRTGPYLGDLRAPPWLVGSAWAVLGTSLFVGRARAGMPDRRRHGTIVRFVDVPYFIHWCAAVWAFIPSVVATIAAPIVDAARGMPVHLPMGWYMGSYLSGLVVCGYGIIVRRRWFRVVEREVFVRGLDPRFDGLRIAQLSDLHVGTLTPKSWGLAWSHAANRCAPDLAVVTGDMITSGTEYHDDVAEVIGALRAKVGVFVSMGNHDYFGDGEPLISLLRERNVNVLRNEGVPVERDGATLWLAAIDDTWTRRDDLSRALRDRPVGVTTVLLAHDPDRFEQAADAGVEVVLSGHTHGGQIAVPFAARALGLANFAHRYRLGIYRRGRSTLHVSPGLGTTGPPLRLGVAPEVTILVLRAAT
jgi:predicted MPP superfamily phosphohydrolase